MQLHQSTSLHTLQTATKQVHTVSSRTPPETHPACTLTRDLAHQFRPVVGAGCDVLDLPEDEHALLVDDLAKDDVLAVEEGGGLGGDEELAAVRIRARVGLQFWQDDTRVVNKYSSEAARAQCVAVCV